MGITISNKAMIVTDFKNLIPLASGILANTDVDHYQGESSLSSLAALNIKLKEESNLSFLKKDILTFIQENGYPFVIIIDFTINTGLDGDHEHLKIFKTLLLSYIVILQSEQYKDISCNLVILMNKNEYNNFKEIYKHPQNIINILKTNDERLNSIIHEYTINDEKFKRNFNILVTDAEQELSLTKSELILFTNMIRSREKLKSKLQKPAAPINGPKINSAPAADVLLRAGNNIFKNGEAADIYNEELNLEEKEVYILGNFTSYTRLDVISRILTLIKKGFGSEYCLKKGDSLTLNIHENSIIDSTTPITLAQLIAKELLDYKNIKIKITPIHYQTMQQSQGFSMIQRNLVLTES